MGRRPTAEAPILRLEQVRRRFVQGATELEILKGIDLEIRPGTLAALVGPSGTGKSTLLHIAGLLERPTGGEVVIEGEVTGELGDRERTRLRRERIGFRLSVPSSDAGFLGPRERHAAAAPGPCRPT